MSAIGIWIKTVGIPNDAVAKTDATVSETALGEMPFIENPSFLAQIAIDQA
jgi:hypothetical protein